MVPVLAKNAVKIKLGFEHAGLTGNYECAYTMGLITSCFGLEEKEVMGNVPACRKEIIEQLDKDEKILNQEKNSEEQEIKLDIKDKLLYLLENYIVQDLYDEQMEVLYHDGCKEKIN
jgi:hypothetical protein